ncbi:MAG: hypothetical protein KTR28_02220 [Micavibrio sp.]|nr:hypothetical protein [Micavibrio sp.]
MKISKMKEVFKNRPRKAKMKNGAEICDPKPLVLPTGLRPRISEEEKFRRMLAQALGQNQQEQSDIYEETDFDIDEPDMLTAYERQAIVFDTVPEYPEEQAPSPSAKQSGSAASGADEGSTAKQSAPSPDNSSQEE